MSKSKLATIMAVGALAAPMLVACGDTGSSEPTEVTVTETVTETSAVETTVTETETITETPSPTTTPTSDQPSSSGELDDGWDPVRDGGSQPDPYS